MLLKQMHNLQSVIISSFTFTPLFQDSFQMRKNVAKQKTIDQSFWIKFSFKKRTRKIGLRVCLIQVVFWHEKLWQIFRSLVFLFLFSFSTENTFSVFQIWFFASTYKKIVFYLNVIICGKRDSHWREIVVYFSFYIK